jgi:hypothetical protein
VTTHAFFKRHKCDRLCNFLEIISVNYFYSLKKPRYLRYTKKKKNMKEISMGAKRLPIKNTETHLSGDKWQIERQTERHTD